MRKAKHIIIAGTMTALVWGCGPEASLEESEESGTAPSEAEPMLDTQEQELPSIGAYLWQAPAPSTPMGSTSNRICGLTRVQGRLDTASDSISIYALGTSWYLGGSSGTSQMLAGARCASRPAGTAISGQYQWKAGQGLPTNMGPTSGRVCFLTHVRGGFNSASDWVRVYVSGGSWFIFGNSTAAGNAAGARCVTVPTYSGEYSWNSNMAQPVHMGPTTGRVCALTGIQGTFDRLGDFVLIFPSSGSWYLGGASQPAGKYLLARARCF